MIGRFRWAHCWPGWLLLALVISINHARNHNHTQMRSSSFTSIVIEIPRRRQLTDHTLLLNGSIIEQLLHTIIIIVVAVALDRCCCRLAPRVTMNMVTFSLLNWSRVFGSRIQSKDSRALSSCNSVETHTHAMPLYFHISFACRCDSARTKLCIDPKKKRFVHARVRIERYICMWTLCGSDQTPAASLGCTQHAVKPRISSHSDHQRSASNSSGLSTSTERSPWRYAGSRLWSHAAAINSMINDSGDNCGVVRSDDYSGVTDGSNRRRSNADTDKHKLAYKNIDRAVKLVDVSTLIHMCASGRSVCACVCVWHTLEFGFHFISFSWDDFGVEACRVNFSALTEHHTQPHTHIHTFVQLKNAKTAQRWLRCSMLASSANPFVWAFCWSAFCICTKYAWRCAVS